MVAQGLGISIVDPPTAQDFLAQGLHIRPLSVRIDTGFLVIRSSESRNQSLIDEFSAQFIKHFKEDA
ncbi:DNA-binding transcriptional regulator LysR [compost metagenome]